MDRRAHIRELMAFLIQQGPWPSEPALALGRQHWLGPWLKARLDQQPESSNQPSAETRAQLASDFADAFIRHACLAGAWNDVHAALATRQTPTLTLGGLPYHDSLYPHPAAKYSQDLDLLVHQSDLSSAELAIRNAGFTKVRGHNMWRKIIDHTSIELDLHTTPGEEARNPALALAYGQTTEQLFAASESWQGLTSSNPSSPTNGLRLSLPALADNRVIHFFKHYCYPLRHAVELPLILRQPINPDALAYQVSTSRSGRVWAFVLSVLTRWGIDRSTIADPTSPADRAFAADPRINSLIESAANGTGEPISTLAELHMLRGIDRARYAWNIAWPPRHALLEMHGRDPSDAVGVSGALLISRLRAKRLTKAMKRALRR